jgi:hypothetical protein
MPKKNKESLEKLKEAVRRSNQTFFLAIASIFLVSLIVLAFLVLMSMINRSDFPRQPADDGKVEEKLIGGDKDEGGCLVGAGYSWCEKKNKCIRAWEEPCDDAVLDDEGLIKKYLSDNISLLAPDKSAAGGFFTVSEVNFLSNNTVFIGYDDGKDFYNAEVVVSLNPEKEVRVEKFVVKNKNGDISDLQYCENDTDCVPLPSACHPRSCINKKQAGSFERPEICTMMFDVEAAYQDSDCACDLENKECYNKNIRRGAESR